MKEIWESIGEELAKSLLEKGTYVFGISRRDSSLTSRYKIYVHLNVNLSNTTKLDRVLTEILDRIDFSEASMICLVNNAAMLEPLRNIEHCKSEEIMTHLQTGLVAPGYGEWFNEYTLVVMIDGKRYRIWTDQNGRITDRIILK